MPKMIDYFVDPTVHRFGCELLVMERIEQSLADLTTSDMQRSSLSLRDVARLATDAIEALRSLHEDARWIHLDIKPANILLRRSGLSRPKVPSDGSAGGGNPVLLCDFEHARSIDLLMTKLQEQPAGTIQFRSVRQDLLAIGSQAVHPVPSWYPAPPLAFAAAALHSTVVLLSAEYHKRQTSLGGNRFDDLEALGYTLVAVAGGADALQWRHLAADVYSRSSSLGDFKTKVQQLVLAKQGVVSIDGPLHAAASRLNRFLDIVRKPNGVDMRVRDQCRGSVARTAHVSPSSARVQRVVNLQVAVPPDYEYLKSIFSA
jgi:serine/threonine protein kinase